DDCHSCDTSAPCQCCICFSFYQCGDRLDLHSSPTRRSSDLQNQLAGPAAPVAAPLPRPPLTAVATVAEIPVGNPFYAGSAALRRDRKSTRLNSSHVKISYAVFCLKKKTKKIHGDVS